MSLSDRGMVKEEELRGSTIHDGWMPFPSPTSAIHPQEFVLSSTTN